MGTTYGFNLCTSGVQGDAGLGGTITWLNTESITADDASSARANSVATDALTRFLIASAFDFSALPAGYIVTGIEAQIEHRSSVATTGAFTWVIRLFDGTSLIGSNMATGVGLPGTDTEQTFGGPNQRWGLGPDELTTTMIKAAGFGLAIQYKGGASSSSVFVDKVRLRLTASNPADPRAVHTLDFESDLGTLSVVPNGAASYIAEDGELVCNAEENAEPESIALSDVANPEACYLSSGKSRAIVKLVQINGTPGVGGGFAFFGGPTLKERMLAITKQKDPTGGIRLKHWAPNPNWTPGDPVTGNFTSFATATFALAEPCWLCAECDNGTLTLATGPSAAGPWTLRLAVPLPMAMMGWLGIRTPHDSENTAYDDFDHREYSSSAISAPGQFRQALRERDRAARGLR